MNSVLSPSTPDPISQGCSFPDHTNTRYGRKKLNLCGCGPYQGLYPSTGLAEPQLEAARLSSKYQSSDRTDTPRAKESCSPFPNEAKAPTASGAQPVRQYGETWHLASNAPLLSAHPRLTTRLPAFYMTVGNQREK